MLAASSLAGAVGAQQGDDGPRSAGAKRALIASSRCSSTSPTFGPLRLATASTATTARSVCLSEGARRDMICASESREPLACADRRLFRSTSNNALARFETNLKRFEQFIVDGGQQRLETADSHRKQRVSRHKREQARIVAKRVEIRRIAEWQQKIALVVDQRCANCARHRRRVIGIRRVARQRSQPAAQLTTITRHPSSLSERRKDV